MWKVARAALFGAACYALGMVSKGCDDKPYSIRQQDEQVYLHDEIRDTTYTIEKLIEDSELVERIRNDVHRPGL